MLTILIISEAQGTLTAFQQHYCLWPNNRKAHYTSALETTEVATVKRRLNEMCDTLHLGPGTVSRTTLNY